MVVISVGMIIDSRPWIWIGVGMLAVGGVTATSAAPAGRSPAITRSTRPQVVAVTGAAGGIGRDCAVASGIAAAALLLWRHRRSR